MFKGYHWELISGNVLNQKSRAAWTASSNNLSQLWCALGIFQSKTWRRTLLEPLKCILLLGYLKNVVDVFLENRVFFFTGMKRWKQIFNTTPRGDDAFVVKHPLFPFLASTSPVFPRRPADLTSAFLLHTSSWNVSQVYRHVRPPFPPPHTHTIFWSLALFQLLLESCYFLG